MDTQTMIDLCKQHTMYTWTKGDAISPLPVKNAEGIYFYTPDGQRFIDFNSQLMSVHIGHGHPKVREAMKKQIDELLFIFPGTATEIRARVGKLLSEVVPGDINKFFFTLGGAEANENAIRAARLYTGRQKILSRYRSYHGATNLCMQVTGDPRRWANEPGGPGIVRVMDPWPYDYSFGTTEEEITANNLRYLEEVIMYEGPHTIAAMIIETVTGTNGILPPPKGYLAGLRKLLDKHGILLICDEVMAGWGRTGKLFAFEHGGIVPDMVTMAKGMAIGGGIFNVKRYVDEIAQTLRRELDYREEVAQLRAYRAALEPWPDLVVPEPVDELCTESVLVLERLRGPTMLQFAEDPSSSAEERYRVAAQLVAAIWGPFLRQGLIHADPHPGNYIVLPDGRLGVLDFGATKTHSMPFTASYWKIVSAAAERREVSIYDVLAGIDFELGSEEDRTRAWLQELALIVERPIRRDFYDWGSCTIAIDCRKHYMSDPAIAVRVRGPVESLMFYRAAVGAAGDFRMLKAAGNFHRVLVDIMHVAWTSMAPELRERVDALGVAPPQ